MSPKSWNGQKNYKFKRRKISICSFVNVADKLERTKILQIQTTKNIHPFVNVADKLERTKTLQI